MSEPICDFCMSPNVQWTHPPKDNTTETQLAGATDDPILPVQHVFNATPWAACSACSKLVVAKDIKGLAKRAARKGLASMGLSPNKREVALYTDALKEKYVAVLPVLGPRRKPGEDDYENHKRGFTITPV